jgi:hypothetical protein
MTPADFVEMARVNSRDACSRTLTSLCNEWPRVAVLQTPTPCVVRS